MPGEVCAGEPSGSTKTRALDTATALRFRHMAGARLSPAAATSASRRLWYSTECGTGRSLLRLGTAALRQQYRHGPKGNKAQNFRLPRGLVPAKVELCLSLFLLADTLVHEESGSPVKCRAFVSESGRGQPHSKTLARHPLRPKTRSVLECGCPLPLSTHRER
jgi:hypothetical protein